MYDEAVKNNENDDGDNDNDNNDAGISRDQVKQIKDLGSITPADGRHPIHCLTIIGEIEGHYVLPPQTKTTRYEHVIPQLIAIEEDPGVKGLLVVLNTVGGDVEAGLAIAELISGMKKPTVSLVLGGGHSIGVPLAVATNKSFIVPSATMTIHPVRTNGLVLGVSQTLNYFNKMQERITGFIAANSNITEEKFTSLMLNTGELTTDMGSVLKGQDAVDVGLIDSMGKLSDAIAHLYSLIDEVEKANNDGEQENQNSENTDNGNNENNNQNNS